MAENIEQNSGASRRKVKNYFYNARLSRRYHVYALASLVFIGFFEAYAVRILRDIGHDLSLATNVAPEIQESIYSSLINASLMFFGIFLFHSLLTVVYILIIEEKVGGASVAIMAYLDELKKGNYDYKRNLRDRDELQNIMASLKELSAILKEKENS